jgi:hypothetical protein
VPHIVLAWIAKSKPIFYRTCLNLIKIKFFEQSANVSNSTSSEMGSPAWSSNWTYSALLVFCGASPSLNS